MTQKGGDYQRLADYVGARMHELDLDKGALAARLRMTTRQVTNIFSGQGVGDATRSALDNALEWTPGSARTVIAGGEPQELDGAPRPTILLADALHRLEAAEEALHEAIHLLQKPAPPVELEPAPEPTHLRAVARRGRSSKKALDRSLTAKQETP